MSFTYEVSLSATVVQTVTADEHATLEIRLKPILPLEEMRELLRRGLLERGFTEDDGALTRDEDGVAVRVDLERGVVELSATVEQHIEEVVSVEGLGETRREAHHDAERQLDRARDDAEARVRRAGARAARQEAGSRIEAAAHTVEGALNDALQGVYAEALKKKATQLGDVLSVYEGTTAEGEYELIIKVAT